MSRLIIKNCKILNNSNFKILDLEVENGRISKIAENLKSDNEYDAKGLLVSPGFIDIHTHGGLSHDSLETSIEAHEAIAKFHLFNGTTAYCPTFLAATIDEMSAAIQTLRKFNKTNKFARCIGIHVEGSFCSPDNNGAQDKNLILNYSKETMNFFKNNNDIIKRITLAPDIKDSAKIAKEIKKLKIQVSLGHDNSLKDEITQCILAGANSITHIYNCSTITRRVNGIKQPGLTELALMNKNMFVEVIADGKHVPNDLLEIIYRMKGKNKIVFVSDSISVAGLKDNEECFLEPHRKQRPVIMKDGIGILKDTNTVAGSGVALINILKNVFSNSSIPLANIINMATINPAKLLGLNNIGRITHNAYADLNILDNDLNIVDTFINGEIVKK